MTISNDKRLLDLFSDALDIDEALREDWLLTHVPDQTMRNAIIKLIKADAQASQSLPTDFDLGDLHKGIVTPQSIGPYRLCETIGEGGMGEVWRAQRDDGLFDHEVAIKLIRSDIVSDKARMFFETERQALARLNHPNIARLLDGGVTEQGQAWFSMELIQGHNLNEHLALNPLLLKSKVELLLKLCRAVHYAHQKLIVHCDIKPSNILIDEDQEPHLVDFGIASLTNKPLQESPSSGIMPSTPAYASPQRLAGEPPSTSDDVYSLGVVLNGLIQNESTDHAPISGVILNDLKAICAKAMATAQEARYASVEAMGQDLDNWLKHKPISQNAGSWTYQAKLLFARHPGIVIGAISAFCGLILSLVMITSLFLKASHEQARAEARLLDVRAVSAYVLSDLYDALEQLPGAATLKAKTSLIARQYLEKISQDAAKEGKVPEALKRELAMGYGRLGHAQSLQSTNSSGALVEGAKALDQSETLMRAILADRPDDQDTQQELARVLIWQSGIQLGVHNDAKAAHKKLDEAFVRLDKRLQMKPNDPEAEMIRLNAVLGRLDVYGSEDRHKDTISLAQASLQRLKRINVPQQYLSQNQLIEAGIENALGDAVYFEGDPKGGLGHYFQAYELMKAARANGLKDIRLAQRQMLYILQIASSYQDMKQPLLGLEWIEKGIALSHEVSQFDDSPLSARIDTILRSQKATLLSDMGRHKEAIETINLSITERTISLKNHPEDMDTRISLAGNLRLKAQYQIQAGQSQQACLTVKQALADFAVIEASGGIPNRFRRMDYEPLLSMNKSC